MSSDQFEQEQEKSRSQKKREAEAVQDLGERLVALSEKQLLSLQLDDLLLEAVRLAKTISSFSGKKRQLQYIGKLMRNVDIAPIEKFFFDLDNHHQQETAKFKALENWRDRLLEQGVSVIAELEREYPLLDHQKLRQLVRNASNEKNEKLALKSRRAIFQYLKELSAL